MSIDEKDKIAAVRVVLPSASTEHKREEAFIQQFKHGPEKGLVHPFGSPDWRLALPAILCTVVIIILATRILSLGVVPVEWMLTFNVNIVVALVILVAGVLQFVGKGRKKLQELRSRNTIVSLAVLALLIVFFLTNVLNLGTFQYTLEELDINNIVNLLLAAVILALALRGSHIAAGILGALFLWWGVSIQDFSLTEMFGDLFTSNNGGRLLRALMPPNWGYFGNVIEPMVLTVQTAVLATVIGIAGALPLSILAARNTSPHPVIYNTIRLLVNTIRAVPSLILALLFIPFVGLGPGAGILGLGIHTISTLTKLYAEAIESVKPQPIEALSAVGANGLKSFRWGVFPQAFPLLASYSIYSWESNGRDSTVVAFVGGGGIGFLLQANLSLLNYANVAVMLIVLILTVSLLDRLSDFVRSRII